jgi:hypothetical protein
MNSISIRYGESVTLPLDAGDVNAVSADIYIGKPGETYVLTKHIVLDDGLGTFVFDTNDTAIPLGTYYYQINIVDSDGYVEKYPSPTNTCDDCDIEFPEFIVCEALDVAEVS